MDGSYIVNVVVAVIAGLSGYAAQRSSSKAAGKVKVESSRVDMEKSAYERARAFDTETIARQNRRIAELAREVRLLQEELKELKSNGHQ